MRICEDSVCTGCAACAAACSVKAIEMKPDERGFLYPVFDTNKCVSCHKCESVCPQKEFISAYEGEVFAALARNDGLRRNSSSGGVFYLLAQWVL